MAQKFFRVQFDLPANKLSTVVSLVQDEVTNLVIRDTAMLPNQSGQPPQQPAVKRTRMAYRRSGGMVATVYGHLSTTTKVGNTVTYDHIKKLIANGGWNATSHTSLISNMVREGYVERQGAGVVKVLKPFPSKEKS